MNIQHVYQNYKLKNYNNIIDILFDDIAKISECLEKDSKYDHTIIKGTSEFIIESLNTLKIYDTIWLKTLRELIFYLTKKNKQIIIEEKSKYYVVQVNDIYKIKIMMLFILFYNYDSKSLRVKAQKKSYAGLDFEFNQRKIALCQLCCFTKRKQKYIFVFDPNMLDQANTTILINNIFVTEWIYKICHGSDSLDTPYIFHELFMNNHEYILSFIMKMIDTRFLCEYYKNIVNDEKKCSIYDAMYYFNTFDKIKYDELVINNENMGPVQDVNWNVMKMSSFHLKYSVYDVLFLQSFYASIKSKHKLMGQKIYLSYKILVLITRFIFLEKANISDLSNRIKQIIDPINNYLIKTNEGNITLITIYTNVTKDFVIESENLTMNHNDIININYFKTNLTTLFKMIIYTILVNEYTVYKNKNDLFTEKLSLDDIKKTITMFNLNSINKIVELFRDKALKNIKKDIIEIS